MLHAGWAHGTLPDLGRVARALLGLLREIGRQPCAPAVAFSGDGDPHRGKGWVRRGRCCRQPPPPADGEARRGIRSTRWEPLYNRHDNAVDVNWRGFSGRAAGTLGQVWPGYGGDVDDGGRVPDGIRLTSLAPMSGGSGALEVPQLDDRSLCRVNANDPVWLLWTRAPVPARLLLPVNPLEFAGIHAECARRVRSVSSDRPLHVRSLTRRTRREMRQVQANPRRRRLGRPNRTCLASDAHPHVVL
jgi:hypothetical protein